MLGPIVLDAHNPGPMTGGGNRTFLLVSAGDAALIDAGVGHPAHIRALQGALDEHRAALRVVAVTHGHADHASGAPALAEAYPSAEFAKHPGDAEPPAGVRWRALSDGETVSIGATELRAVHTPGHSPDHVAFWHEPSRALFTGDLVIAGGSVTIPASRGGNLIQYLDSLRRVLELDPARLFPSHGPSVDDPATLVRSHIEHRSMRERQIVAAIQAGLRTVEQIAGSIYDGLDSQLLAAARENVRAHLEKLAAEQVVVDRDGWRML
jgi:glyoxylase-like metal-dependent hydrolase (beta-lactamase superfamily II)